MSKFSCRRIKDNLSAYLDGELTSELNVLIEKHLQGCSSCQAILSNLKSLRERLTSLAQPTAFEESPINMIEMIASRLPKYNFWVFTDPVIRRATVVMAMLVIFLLGGLKLKQGLLITPPSEPLVTDIVAKVGILKTEPGSQLRIHFQDGSALLVKENSLLEIKALTPDIECVLDQGEALVFVATVLLNRKFVMHIPKAEIQVLGTSFKIYVGEKRTEIEVLRGEVKVEVKVEETKDFVLKESEKIVIDREDKITFSQLLLEEVKVLKEEFSLAKLPLEIKKKPVIKRPSIIFWREIKE